MLVEVILLALARRVLEPLVVHGETLHQILVQAPDGPLAELRAPVAAHAKTDREDGVQVVVLNLPRDFTLALRSNYSEFPNSCPRRQFSLGVDAFQVLIYGWNRHLEQFGNERLRQPQRLVFETALDAGAAILRLVQDDFGIGQSFVTHRFRLISMSF